MADANDQQQGAGAGGNGDQDDARASFKLQNFTGKEPVPEVKAFLRQVDAVRAILNLNDERTSSAVQFALRGKAKEWLAYVHGEHPAATIASWATFKPIFEERWVPEATWGDMGAASEFSSMKDDQTVTEYYDQVGNQTQRFCEFAHERLKTNHLAEYNRVKNVHHMKDFVRGLIPEIRREISKKRCEQTFENADKRNLLRLALEEEKKILEIKGFNKKNGHGKSPFEIKEVRQEDGNTEDFDGMSEAQVEAVFRKFGNRFGYQRRKGGNGNNNGNNRRNQNGNGNGNGGQNGRAQSNGNNNNGNNSNGWKPRQNGGNGNNNGGPKCFGCMKTGHILANCPIVARVNKSVNEIETQQQSHEVAAIQKQDSWQMDFL